VRPGARALVIDADPQGSAPDWSGAGDMDPKPPVLGMPQPKLHHEIPTLAADFDNIVIDGPPQTEAIVRSAMVVADFVLIPVQPSGVDVRARGAPG
jgi:chromosome partitioning protein